MSKGVFEVWSRKMETLRDDALMEYDRAKSEEEGAVKIYAQIYLQAPAE